jgi:RHS repeat-associated protein
MAAPRNRVQSRKSLSGRACLPWLAMILAFAASSAAVSAAGLGTVNLSTGGYSQVVPVQVPVFHGLEPKLALTYSSQGGNGFAGVGWRLSGFSTVEWVRTWGGAPDKYLLDGQELVACQPGSVSPSCTTGGTHSTKIESYLRIKFDSAANTWSVWGKDGTKTVFSPTLIDINLSGTPTVRWGQTSVTDTYGNTVAYGWSCVGGDCYPNTVAYNGYSVTLYREIRPDVQAFAEDYSVGTTQYRLRSLVVQLGASPIRGYQLTYAVSPVTKRSLLTSVQQYGKDLVQSSGSITGGTSLPAQTFVYSSDALGQTFQAAPAPPTPPTTVEPVSWVNLVGVTAVQAGNSLNKPGGDGWDAGASSSRAISSGDGYMEVVVDLSNNGAYVAGLSNGDSNVNYPDVDFGIYNYYGTIFIMENGGYFGGWPAANNDRLRVEVTGGVVRYKKNGTLLYTSTHTPVYPLVVDTSVLSHTAPPAQSSLYYATISGALIDVGAWCGNTMLTGDFNGDGRTDQLCYGPGGVTRVRLSTPTGLGSPTLWLSSWALGSLVVGDFNGDGRTDLGDYEGDYFYVALSTGSGFSAPVSWGHSGSMYGEDSVGHACYGAASIMSGDFNGDGNADVFCRTPTDNHFIVGLSNGASAFSFSVWSFSPCQGLWGLGDFNGDGLSDLYCIDGSNNAFNAYPSNGSTFLGGSDHLDGTFCYVYDYVLGDFNGDGRTDVACKGNGNVALSTGYRMAPQGAFGGWCYSGAAFAADVDGDGQAEIICNNPNSPTNDIEVRKWLGTSLSAAQTWRSSWCAGTALAGDFNGDGKTDLLCTTPSASIAVAGTGGVTPDLVVSSGNGLGGTDQVVYVPSTQFVNTNNPGPAPVVSALTVGDGRGGTSLTTYVYAGRAINRREHQALGFASATVTLPCVGGETTCPSSETSFMQDVSSVGKVSTVVQRDQSGRPLTQKTFLYSTNGVTVPRTSLLTSEWTYAFDGSGTSCATYPCPNGKRTLRTNQYDLYGNTTRTDFSGDFDALSDESATVFGYFPNSGAYLVGPLAYEKVYGPGSTLARSTAYAYDGQADFTLPAIRGSVTKKMEWLNTESRWVTTSMSYDAFGNVVATLDATGRAITTTFDTTYHVFPMTVANGAGESESTAWDASCGSPVQTTDSAGQVTSSQLDTLCRQIRKDGPLGSYEIRRYLSYGDPNNQRLVVSGPSATPDDGSGDDFAAQYLDGLGRAYRVVKKGPSPTHDIVVDTAYDARGQVASRSAPYYAPDIAYRTLFAYDALGRLTATTFPDETTTTTSYGVWSESAQDAHGHITSTLFDAYARTIMQGRHLGTQVLQVRYSYDTMGRLIGTTDAAGNVWSWTVDFLGRDISRSDPDAGVSTYQYDDAGRMTAQTDARVQRTDFTYDLAGRLASKTNASGTTTINRSEPRAGFLNTGLVTTVASPASTLTTDYDALGRAVQQTRTMGGIEYTVLHRFDTAGRLRGITYPDGDIIGPSDDPIEYDAAGRLAAVPGIVSELLYDASGRPTHQGNANGTSTTREISPDRGWLTRIVTSGAGTIQDLHYSRDAGGLLTAVTSPFPDESFTYTYDDLHRLTVAGSTTRPQSFSYDETGSITLNSLVGAYVYPASGSARPHAPTSVGSNSQSYDGSGNLVSGGGRAIVWNADNLPTQIDSMQLTYDGLGDRLSSTTATSSSLYPFADDYEITNGTVTKYFVLDSLGIVAKRVGGATFWIHTDAAGSIQAVTDSNSVEIQRRTYRPYGEKIADTTSHVESHGYIGERLDENGLIYLHARYYDPVLGVFLSADTLDGPGASVATRYTYANGDPINLLDPIGLEPQHTECHQHRGEDGLEYPECNSQDDVTVIGHPTQPIGGAYPEDPARGHEPPQGGRNGHKPPPVAPHGAPINWIVLGRIAAGLKEAYCAVTEATGGVIVQGGLSGSAGVLVAGAAGQVSAQIVVTPRGVAVMVDHGVHVGVSGWDGPGGPRFAIGHPGGGGGRGLQPSSGFVWGTTAPTPFGAVRITNAPHPDDLVGLFSNLNIETPAVSAASAGGLDSAGESIWEWGIGTPAGGFSVNGYNTETTPIVSTADPCK